MKTGRGRSVGFHCGLVLAALCQPLLFGSLGCEKPDDQEDEREGVAPSEESRALLGPRISIGTIDPGTFTLPQDPLVAKMMDFAPYDLNGDGIDEIEDVQLLPFEKLWEMTPIDGRLVLVLVEPRLLDTLPGQLGSADDVLTALERYKSDLRAEGLHSRFVEMSVYSGVDHQDGRTLLAMREFLRDVRADYSKLEGVVLVGSFPEAMLVRRWLWRRDLNATDKVNIGRVDRSGVSYLRIIPEIVAGRAEIVLSDLDGNWHNLYQEGPVNLDSIEAIPTAAMGNNWPINGTFDSAVFDFESETFEDFFWIRDDNFTRVATNNGTLRLNIAIAQRHPEVTASDRAMANPIARPEILVSRINPRHVAVNPDPSLLDEVGLPQSVYSTTPIDLGIGALFHRDAELERQVLLDYFDRNHTYRRGGYSALPARTSAIRGPDTAIVSPASLNTELKKSSTVLGTSLSKDLATLDDYVNWYKTPAVLRGIAAHSSPWNSAFGGGYTVANLEASVGGKPWRWRRSGNWYLPSLQDQSTEADLYIHRTIWENGILEGTGANLFIHVGCEANYPGGAADSPYNASNYGSFQNAEGLLFFMNGLAVMTRAKTFFDAPQNFGAEIGKDERNGFGLGWRGYFDADAGNAALASVVADNKKTYFWSVLGDWTLRVNYESGLGALGVEGSKLTDHAVQADRSWIGGWNYDAATTNVAAKGDFDGDGADDLLVTSSWGIGILSADGLGGFQTKLAKPNGTAFGGWNYSFALNGIQGTGDFDGDGADEIVVTSSWGIGILDFDGTNMTSLVARPNGTAFGSWIYNSRSSLIEGIGDLDGNGKDEILITNTSTWALGLLALSGSSLTALVNKPKDTWFGSWRLQASVNVGHDDIHAIADFDKDGRDEILLTSSWGIGILDKVGTSFTSIVAKPNGTMFGGWNYTSASNFIKGVGDVDGDGYHDIVVVSSWGIGILEKSGTSLTSIVAKPNGTMFGGWNFSSSANTIAGLGDFDGNGKDDLLITSTWGTGVLALSGSTLWSTDARPHGSALGNWQSEAANRFAFVGDFDGTTGDEILVQK